MTAAVEGQPSLAGNTVLASVVTAPLLREFSLLRRSFQLFHNQEYQWCVRCDDQCAASIENDSTRVATFPNAVGAHRAFAGDTVFNSIVVHKMSAIADAWDIPGTTAVIFLDADIVLTNQLLPLTVSADTEVALTPNYYPQEHEVLAPLHGYFNSGFIFTRNRRFHEEWRTAFLSQPWRYTDQACLNEVAPTFRTAQLDRTYNVGFWRSPHYSQMRFPPFPPNTTFVHGHLLQGLRNHREWIDRTFGLHLLRHLLCSPVESHHVLADWILGEDSSGWYRASLALAAVGNGIGPLR